MASSDKLCLGVLFEGSISPEIGWISFTPEVQNTTPGDKDVTYAAVHDLTKGSNFDVNFLKMMFSFNIPIPEDDPRRDATAKGFIKLRRIEPESLDIKEFLRWATQRRLEGKDL